MNVSALASVQGSGTKTALQLPIVSIRVEPIMVIDLLEYRRKKAAGGAPGRSVRHQMGIGQRTDFLQAGA